MPCMRAQMQQKMISGRVKTSRFCTPIKVVKKVSRVSHGPMRSNQANRSEPLKPQRSGTV